MDRISVTENQMLEALRAAMMPAGVADGASVQELSAATGRPIHAVRMGLRKMIAAGTAEVARGQRPRLDGIIGWVPCYKLKGPLP